MSDETQERLDAIRERLAKVIGLPWRLAATSNGGAILLRGPETPRVDRHPQSHLQIVPEDDAALIANSPSDLAWLLSLVDSQRSELEAARAKIATLETFDQAWVADDPEQYIENPHDAGDFCDIVELNRPTKMLVGKRLPSQWVVVFADEDDCPETKWFATEDEARAFAASSPSVGGERHA